MLSKLLYSLLLTLVFPLYVFSQCGPATPTFTVNLTGNPSGTWLSPNVVRNDQCCGNTGVVCVKFIITLDPAAAGISFGIASGAIPGGALYYQVNCGPQTALGTPICLSGVGPHVITFCKPGNNANVYQITSIPGAVGGSDITVNDGCTKKITATGFNVSTVTWHSVFPGAPGAYNSYLSCTSGCLSPSVTASGGSVPPYVDYVVCGQPAANCNFATVCDTIRVTFHPTLAVNIVPANPTICFGQTSTTLTANGSGGTPPYSYLWNNVNPSQTINVGVGTYNVQLSDASGCPPVFNAVTVTAFSVAITANAGPDQKKCIQSPLATLNGSVTGASGGIWSGGGGTFSPNNTTLANITYSPSAAELASGSVNLVLTTTGNGTCPPKSDTVKITYSGFTGTVTPAVTNVSCFGGSNGTATMTISGGSAPYTYLWNTTPTQTSSAVSNLPIGTYSVTIQDAIGCKFQTSATITQPPILAVTSTVSNVSCFGTTTGSISLTPVGGTTPYSYVWNPGGQTTSSVTSLAAGNYSATITDANGCIKTTTATITQPAAIAITYTQTNVSCFNGSNGTASTTVTGGTSPYTFAWSPGGATSQNVTGLQAGTYTLTVKDALNCTATATVTITQPPVLTASVTATNETCNYLNNGSVSATQTGGTASYTYSWMPGGQTSAAVTNLPSGSYTVVVTDSKGCPATAVANITEPTPLTVSFVNQVNVSCFGGSNASVGASPSGGTPNYIYSWAPGGTTGSSISNIPIGTYSVTVTDNNSCVVTNTVLITQPTDIVTTSTITNVSCNGGSNGTISLTPSGGVPNYSYLWPAGGQTTSSVSGLAAGSYSVIVTDANSCPKSYVYTVTQPLPIAITYTQTNVSCFNGSNGTASTTVTGGTSPYTFAWSPGGATSQNVTGLQAGTYTLTVKDALNCTATATVTITQPPVLTASVTATNETCNYLNNGSVSATQTGGTASYTYSWMPGGQTSAAVTNLPSGSYTVVVTDSKGCPATAVANITEPTPLTVSFVNQVNVSCFGGSNASVGASPSGGTPNYIYSWAPGGATSNGLFNIPAGVYTVTITDNNSCTVQNTVAITQPTAAVNVTGTTTSVTCNGGSNGSATATATGGTSPYSYSWMPGSLSGQTITGISAGIYSVTATDFNNCAFTNTITVIQAAPILPVTTSTNSTCGNSNGIGSVSVSGGQAPYTYQWMPAGGTNSVTTNLPAANYNVTVTDANNCSASQYLNINDSGGPVASIFSITDVTCYGGSDGTATAGVSGGLAPITFSWSPYGGTGQTATGLVAGTYYVTVTDANGCQSLATTSPDVLQPPPIVTSFATANVSCFGGANGSATVTAGGGTPAYTYSWMPGASTSSVVTGLSAGTHSVQIKDANNCVHTATYAITQPTAALAASATSTAVSCFAGNNGSTFANATGGTSPYNYTWMPGNWSGQGLSNLTAGTYTATVKDINNCTTTTTVTVTQPTAIVLATGSNNSNCGAANGQASVSASGGTGAYSYSWSPTGGTAATATSLSPQMYTVQVTDANGCIATASQSVSNNPGPNVSVSSTTSVSCFGGSNATATASVTGGTGPFTYTWSPSGGNNATTTGVPAGTYTVYVTAANGCLTSAISPAITQPTVLFSTITTSNVSCAGGTNGSATVTAGGGTPAYTYSWMPGASTSSVVTGLSAGTHSVQIKDANNCVHMATYAITQPTAALAASATSTAVSCFAGNNGTALATASGGTSPYSYTWLPMSTSSQSVTGLAMGIYTVNVTDFKNCSATATVAVTQPTLALNAIANSAATSCSGGSDGTATVTPTGGTGAYSYSWSPSGGNAQTASGLNQGTYFVTVSDANGCLTNVSIIVSSPTAVSGSLTVTNPACGLSNGSITSQVSGGNGPYSYAWSPVAGSTSTLGGLAPGNYTLQATDSKNCPVILTASLTNIAGPTLSVTATLNDSCFGSSNGSTTISISQGTSPYTINWLPFGGNTTTASQLTAGVYTANVTDGLGCLTSITSTITEPNPVSISISTIVNVSCFNGSNGSITVAASGGTPGYSYSWLPTGTGPTINNLAAGSYTVNVKDQHLCSSVISMNVTQPAVLSSTISSVSNPLCYSGQGSSSVNVSGGTAPYTYTWSSTPAQNGSTAQNIGSGTYTVSIADANGCSTSNTVTLTQPAQVKTLGGLNDTICLNQAGAVSANASGGAGGYYYAWQPSGVINSGTLTINPAVATTNYTVVAFDQNGCAGVADTVTAVVYSLTNSNIQAIGLTPICPGQSTTIYAQTSGVTGPLTYTWNNGLGSGPGAFVTTPIKPTTYIVTVTNACGASVTDSVRVLFNPPPTVSVTPSGTLACIPGMLTFFDNSVTGNPNDPITNWSWNFGDGTTSNSPNPSHSYTVAGTYSVSVTVVTNGGCTNNNASAPIVVQAYPYPVASFSINATTLNLPYDVLSCTNQSSGAVTYNWNFGDGGTSTATNPNHTYTSVGIYQIQLIATSPQGCSDTAYRQVITDADVVFPNAFTPNTNGPSGGGYVPGSLDNDIFFPYTSGVVEYKFQIFNRWGELIFETEDIKQGWDGYYRDKICQLGVYVWKAYVKLNNGKVFNKTGDVTLLR